MSSARMVGLRLYLCASGLLSTLAVVRRPDNFFVEDNPLIQGVVLALMLTVCALGVTDAVLNDLLGDRWALQWVKTWRHDGYIGLAVVNLALIYVAAKQGAEGPHLLRFGLDAATAVYVAFRDIKLRFIDPRKESSAHAHPSAQ